MKHTLIDQKEYILRLKSTTNWVEDVKRMTEIVETEITTEMIHSKRESN